MTEDITRRKRMASELVEVRRRLAASQEAERLHLAQELHDGPIQDLYGLSYQLNHLEQALAEESDLSYLASAQQTVLQTTRTLREICYDLRPPTLAPFGLEVAIRSHTDQFREVHPELDIELSLMPDGQTIPQQMRLSLFRIYQQALSNVMRHAGARRVMVRFEFQGEEMLLEIRDDGRGFNVPERWVTFARLGHLGLVGTAERVDALGGRLEVVSAPGQGTIVRVVVPKPPTEDLEDSP
jgi:signal transduction histidine kinase